MSECNGHIQGEPGHEEIFFCPKCHYIELQAQLAAAEKDIETTTAFGLLLSDELKTTKADLKLCKEDIELRKDYESYLQSTAGPMYSYNSWKKQKGDPK